MPRASWLSLTPEPERELPALVASARAGGAPTPEDVERERERLSGVVVRGRERDWLAYLSEAVELMISGRAALLSVEGRRLALDVLANHHRLLLGLPGDAAERTAAERAALDAALRRAMGDAAESSDAP
ncbi:MAG TPA: hypothetical protein VKG89_00045 [Solirubrobacterales bacterium]|nr:hypothetical protein [Solirubrobacterales bacterium]